MMLPSWTKAAGALALLGALPFAVSRPRPVHAAADQKKLGASLFHERGCEHCHGPNGTGGELGPDLGTIGKRWKKPQIEHQIHDGGGGMPAFGEALQPDEITALVEFLHAKKKPATKAPTAAPVQPQAPAPL